MKQLALKLKQNLKTKYLKSFAGVYVENVCKVQRVLKCYLDKRRAQKLKLKLDLEISNRAERERMEKAAIII